MLKKKKKKSRRQFALRDIYASSYIPLMDLGIGDDISLSNNQYIVEYLTNSGGPLFFFFKYKFLKVFYYQFTMFKVQVVLDVSYTFKFQNVSQIIFYYLF